MCVVCMVYVVYGVCGLYMVCVVCGLYEVCVVYTYIVMWWVSYVSCVSCM